MAYPPTRVANIEQLYTDHHSWLRQWRRRRLGCWHTAEDLAKCAEPLTRIGKRFLAGRSAEQ